MESGIELDRLKTMMFAVLAALSGETAETAVAAQAPRVVKTVPANGDTDVNPNLRDLRIEFDQPMDTGGGFSIVGGGDTFPEITGRPRWLSDRVLVTPMMLKLNHGYWLSVNSSRFQNLKGRNGQPAVPHRVEFKTAANGAAMKTKPLTTAIHRQSVRQLRKAIDENYSYRDLREVNWENRFGEFEARLLAAESRAAFARVCVELLKPAKDVHIWITYDGQTIGTHRRSASVNMDFRWLQNNVPNWRQINRTVFTGAYSGGVKYILIASWSRNVAKELRAVQSVIDQLKEGDKLILDLRANSGGDERLAREVAGRFVSSPVVYATNRSRDSSQPNGFSKTFDRTLEPNRARHAFRGKIAVLMGPANMSSCEAFLLMMRKVPSCRLIGERSYGASGNPKPATLVNGFEVFLPSWQAMDADGKPFEGKGIRPDVEVKWKKGGDDPVIAEALKRLKED